MHIVWCQNIDVIVVFRAFRSRRPPMPGLPSKDFAARSEDSSRCSNTLLILLLSPSKKASVLENGSRLIYMTLLARIRFLRRICHSNGCFAAAAGRGTKRPRFRRCHASRQHQMLHLHIFPAQSAMILDIRWYFLITSPFCAALSGSAVAPSHSNRVTRVAGSVKVSGRFTSAIVTSYRGIGAGML